jgi:putative glutamine amidotransferase
MAEHRPAIGICAQLVDAQWGSWDAPAVLLSESYIDAIAAAGALALMVPPDPALADDPDEALERIDGLILAGGHDVDPSFYGGSTHPATTRTVPARDRIEIALARRAVALDMPLLGICRGMQVLNVAFGGTLLQHLPEAFGHDDHLRTLGTFDGSDHDVVLHAGSRAALAAGEELHTTKSHHHQGVDTIGDGLIVTGTSTLDELPEAIELSDCRFALGVQWHPEADGNSRVIGALVSAARAYRTARGS